MGVSSPGLPGSSGPFLRSSGYMVFLLSVRNLTFSSAFAKHSIRPFFAVLLRMPKPNADFASHLVS